MGIRISNKNKEIDWQNDDFHLYVDSSGDLIVEQKSSGDTWTFGHDGSFEVTGENIGGINFVQTTEPTYEAGSTWVNPDTGIFYGAYNGDWHPIPPVTVTEETVTFEESDVSVSNDLTRVSNGSISIEPVDTTRLTPPSLNETLSNYDAKMGYKISTSGQFGGVKAKVSAGTSPTSVLLTDTSINTIASVSNVSAGDTVDLNAKLESGKSYYVLTYDGGANYNCEYQTGSSVSTGGPEFDVTYGRDENGDDRSDAGFAFDWLEALPYESGSATISWPSPSDIQSWDLATFQRTLDGETVDIDVISQSGTFPDGFEDGDISGWSGDTGSFSAQQSTVLNGSYSGELTASNTSVGVTSPSTGGITGDLGYRWQLGSDTGNSSDFAQLQLIDSGGSSFQRIRFEDGGGPVVWQPGTTLLSSWSADTLYEIAVDFDFGSDSADVYINGNLVGENLAFQSSASDWDTTNVYNTTTNSGSTRSVFVDDTKTVEYTGISQNFDVSTIPNTKNAYLKANLSRSSTSNNPTLDYAARRYTR